MNYVIIFIIKHANMISKKITFNKDKLQIGSYNCIEGIKSP